MVAYALSVPEFIEIPEPSTYNEAISFDEAAEWTVVMIEEMESLHKNQTWELVKPSRGQLIVGCKWVFKKKEGIPGAEFVRYKARLVAKGYSQTEGVDFNEILSSCEAHLYSRVTSHSCLVRSRARAT